MVFWKKPKDEVFSLTVPLEGTFLEGRELRIIDPASMTFLYSLSKGECHMTATGHCSLESSRPPKGKDGEEEAAYDYCRDLLKSLRKYGQRDILVVEVIECTCGHYEFNDGQHRTCIAQRKGIKIDALVNPVNYPCDICSGRPDKDDELR